MKVVTAVHCFEAQKLRVGEMHLWYALSGNWCLIVGIGIGIGIE